MRLCLVIEEPRRTSGKDSRALRKLKVSFPQILLSSNHYYGLQSTEGNYFREIQCNIEIENLAVNIVMFVSKNDSWKKRFVIIFTDP